MEDLSPSNLAESGNTIPSDSENYDGNNELSSSSPPSSSSTPLILYKPPTLWGLLRGAAINLLLPFVNGLMLGFGELVANEAAFRLGWSGTKVCYIQLICKARSTNFRDRFSRPTAANQDVLVLAWRCALILLSEGGEMDRSLTCTRPWSKGGKFTWGQQGWEKMGIEESQGVMLNEQVYIACG
jgi:hypothetical protein